MAFPIASLSQASIEQLYGAAADDKTRVGMKKVVSLLNEMVGVLNREYADVYGAALDITVTDATDASPTAFLAGEGAALSGSGAVFRTKGGTADFTDNALATAKGSAVATNDVFVFTSGTAVAYLGSQSSTSPRCFGFDGETEADFDAIV